MDLNVGFERALRFQVLTNVLRVLRDFRGVALDWEDLFVLQLEVWSCLVVGLELVLLKKVVACSFIRVFVGFEAPHNMVSVELNP